ncbi:MAG: hypothetical protein ACYDD1_10010 [Caulobacteraceae bacterium]
MNITRKLVLAATTVALLGGVAACGRVALLEQPAPLFGDRNKAEYAAHRDAQLTATQQQRATTNTTGSVDRQYDNTTDDPNANDAPLTTRDIKDPETQLTTPRNSPVPGAPNPMGPTPSLTPQ